MGIKINDNFPLYTHCTSRVQSASSDLASGACLLSLRFCHDGAVERDQVFQGSQTAKKKKRLEKANNTIFVAEVKAKAEAGEEEQQEKVVNKPITAPPGDEREVHANRL